MPQENQDQKTCACASRHLDLLRAAPPKRDWLRKVACPRCKKIYLTNRETDYCLDCESGVSNRASLT